jgi:mannose-6-phosphate isomerase-like protein (cupin superfamily)
MKIIEKQNAVCLNPDKLTSISEFQMDYQDISGALAAINGRYPESGLVLNEVSSELVYVLKGSGKIITSDNETAFKEGDVIYIDKKESFAWEGNFEIFMATSPKFDPSQHKSV